MDDGTYSDAVSYASLNRQCTEVTFILLYMFYSSPVN